jgi:diguanylate cyclase (GGDEF)-like protein
VGDAVLLEVAARLRGTIGPEALAARTGGDEFVVLAAATTQDQALAIGDAISQALRRPYRLNDAVIQSGGSIGIALPDANASLSELMKRADGGLYRIKALGGDARLADGAIGTEAQLEIAGL